MSDCEVVSCRCLFEPWVRFGAFWVRPQVGEYRGTIYCAKCNTLLTEDGEAVAMVPTADLAKAQARVAELEALTQTPTGYVAKAHFSAVCGRCGTVHADLPRSDESDGWWIDVSFASEDAEGGEWTQDEQTGTWRCDRCEAAEAEAQGSGEPAARAIYSNGATDRDGDWLEDETQGGGEQ